MRSSSAAAAPRRRRRPPRPARWPPPPRRGWRRWPGGRWARPILHNRRPGGNSSAPPASATSRPGLGQLAPSSPACARLRRSSPCRRRRGSVRLGQGAPDFVEGPRAVAVLPDRRRARVEQDQELPDLVVDGDVVVQRHRRRHRPGAPAATPWPGPSVPTCTLRRAPPPPSATRPSTRRQASSRSDIVERVAAAARHQPARAPRWPSRRAGMRFTALHRQREEGLGVAQPGQRGPARRAHSGARRRSRAGRAARSAARVPSPTATCHSSPAQRRRPGPELAGRARRVHGAERGEAPGLDGDGLGVGHEPPAAPCRRRPVRR